MNGLYEDLSACFAALINVLDQHGVPRAAVAEAFHRSLPRALTLQSQYPEDSEERFVLLHGIATLAETHGRDG